MTAKGRFLMFAKQFCKIIVVFPINDHINLYKDIKRYYVILVLHKLVNFEYLNNHNEVLILIVFQ